MKTRFFRMITLSVCLLFGCSSSIDSTGEDGEQGSLSAVPNVNESGDFTMTVDASDYQEWAYLNLTSGIVTSEQEWDLALRRTAIRLNGGVSGTGSGLGQRVGPAEFDAVETSPPSGWITDGDMDGQFVLAEWYDYHPETHVLTPKPGTWFIRDGRDQNYYALVILDYYDALGNSGMYTLKWKPIDAPDAPPELVAGTGELPTDEAGTMGDDMGEMDTMEPVETTPAHGCYPGPPTHMCDCEMTAEACAETTGVWTDLCKCDERE